MNKRMIVSLVVGALMLGAAVVVWADGQDEYYAAGCANDAPPCTQPNCTRGDGTDGSCTLGDKPSGGQNNVCYCKAD